MNFNQLNFIKDKHPKIIMDALLFKKLSTKIDEMHPIPVILDNVINGGFSIEQGWFISHVDDQLLEVTKFRLLQDGKLELKQFNWLSGKLALHFTGQPLPEVENPDEFGVYTHIVWANDAYMDSIERRLGLQHHNLQQMIDSFLAPEILKIYAVQFILANYRELLNLHKNDNENRVTNQKVNPDSNAAKKFYDPTNRTVKLGATRGRTIVLSDRQPERKYLRHTDEWIKRGHWRIYRNPDGSVKKKIWIKQTTAHAKNPRGTKSYGATYKVKG